MDISGIIDGLEKIKKQLQDTEQVDPKQLKKMEEAIEAASKKGADLKRLFDSGLTSKKDVERMAQLTEDFEKLTSKATGSLSNTNAAVYKKQIQEIEQALQKATATSKELIEAQKTLFTGTAVAQGFSTQNIQDMLERAINGVDFATVVDLITKRLEAEKVQIGIQMGQDQSSYEALKATVSQIDATIENITDNILNLQNQLSKYGADANSPMEQIKKDIKEYQDIIKQWKSIMQLKTPIPEAERATFSDKNQGFDITGAAHYTSKSLSVFRNWLEGNGKNPYFISLKQGIELNADARNKIKQAISNAIAESLSPTEALQKFWQSPLQFNGMLAPDIASNILKVDPKRKGLSEIFQQLWKDTPYMTQLQGEIDKAAQLKKNLEDILALRKDMEKQQTALGKAQTERDKAEEQRVQAEKELADKDKTNQERLDNLNRQEQALQTDKALKQQYESILTEQQKIGQKEKEANEERTKALKVNTEISNNITQQNNKTKQKIQLLQEELKSAKNVSTVYSTINKNFDQIISRMSYMFSALSVFRTIVRAVKQTFSDIQNLDKAFGSIAMVTTKSVQTLWGQYEQYASIANKLGQQTRSAVEASALYYQQGLQTAEVLKLTESTMKLATLAGQDFQAATKEMTAAIRAFNMEMTEGERITDVYSELAAHAAADVNGIATAMSKVASIAASSGSKFENIAAFLTQIIETTQEAATNAGTALKTVIARFSEIKKEIDTTDPDFADFDYNKMDTALKSVGITLKDSTGQIRAFDEVILELGGIWDSLSRNQQRYIATVAAGSRQQSRFLALMENNERLIELIQIAEESSGKSQMQFNKYADTIEYKINRIKNTWEQFRVRLINAETIKKALSYFNILLERLTKWTASDLIKVGSAFLLLGQTAAEGFAKGIKGVSLGVVSTITMITKSAQKGIDYLINSSRNQLNTVFSAGRIVPKLSSIEALSAAGKLGIEDKNAGTFAFYNKQLYTKSQAKRIEQLYGTKNAPIFGRNSTGIIPLEQKQAIDKQLAEAEKQRAMVQGQAYGTTFATSALAAITSLSIRNKAENVWEDIWKAGGITAGIQVVNTMFAAISSGASQLQVLTTTLTTGIFSAAIVAVSAGISYLIKRAEEIDKLAAEQEAMNNQFYTTKKIIEELAEQEESLKTKISEVNSELEQSENEYEELVSTAAKLKELQGKNILDAEQQQELNEASEKMLQIAPELFERYNAEGTAIFNLTLRYEELLKAKREVYAENKKASADLQTQLAINQYSQVENRKIRQEDLKDYLTSNRADVINHVKRGIGGYVAPTKTEGGKKGALAGGLAAALLALLAAPATGGVSLPILLAAAGVGAIGGGTTGYLSPDLLGQQVDVAEYLEKNKGDLALQDALQEIFAEDNIFNIQGKTGVEVVEAISEKIKKGQDYITLFSQKVDKFVNSNKNFEKDLSNNWAEIRKSILESTEARLMTNEKYYEEEDKFIQSAMVRYAKYASGLNFDYNVYKRKKEGEELRIQGLSGLDEADRRNLLIEWENQYITDMIDSVNNVDLSNVDFKIWNEVKKDFEKNLPANELAIIIQEKLGGATEQVAAWFEENEDLIRASEAQAEKVAYAFNLALKEQIVAGNKVKYFDDEGLGAVFSHLGEIALSRFVKGYDQAKNKQQFVQDMKELLSSINAEEFTTIFNEIDWDTYSILTSESFFEGMSEGAKKARPMLEHWFANLNFSPDSMIEELDKKLTEELKEGVFSSWGKAVKSSIENGFVDEAAIKALRKAGADISSILKDDASLDEEALRSWVDTKVDEMQQAVELAIYQLKKQKSGWQAVLNTYSDDLNSEVVRNILERQGFSAEEAISGATLYLNSGLTSKEFAQAQVEQLEKDLNEANKIFTGYSKAVISAYNAQERENEEARAKSIKEEEELQEKREKGLKAIEDAYDDIIKKQEALAEAQRKLNDTLYGSGTRKTSLDDLYNYQTALDALNASIEEIKENLEDFEGSPKELLDQLFSTTRNKAVYLEAENDRYNAAIKSTYNSLVGQVNDYMKTIGNGSKYNTSDFFQYNPLLDRYEIDQAAINSAQINDDFKGFIEKQIDLMNQYKKNIQNNNKEIKKTEKDLEDYRNKARDNYISVEEEVVKKLEEFYKKQIDDKKEMYDALSEADNEYLDALQKAIDKQRKLRDQQDKWNELSTKEKRLSLIQRDTSGANRKDIQKLQKEIQKDRTSMLDTSVDNIINNLKEMYELQKESREDELKYQEAIVENTNLVAEANAIMQSWKSLDDMRAWMYEHTKNIEDMSDASVEKLSDDWEKMYNNIQIYNELSKKKVEENFENTSNEVQDIIFNTTESLTSEASRAFAEIQESVNQAIKNAYEAVNNAMKALTDAQEKYNKALKDYEEIQQEIERLKTNYYNKKGINPSPYAVDNESLHGIARDEAFKDIVYDFKNRDANETISDFLSRYQDNYELAEEAITYVLRSSASPTNPVPDTMIEEIMSGQIGKVEGIWTPEGLMMPGYLNKLRENGIYVGRLGETFYYSASKQDIEDLVNKEAPSFKGNVHKYYKQGGLVDYTGPAWVDGTKRRPEAFLNSEDTMRIGQAASILRDLVSYSRATFSNATLSPNIRESNTEIHIHVDSIATESQVDYLIDRVKEEIVDAANPIGSSVILH